jgi:Protein of unknown function (DUF2889)
VDGREIIVHEYGLNAAVEIASTRIVSVEAVPHVLPWQECPLAASSAGRLVGMSVQAVRREVPRELSGISSCTHLNDLLRSLADVERLAGLIPTA